MTTLEAAAIVFGSAIICWIVALTILIMDEKNRWNKK